MEFERLANGMEIPKIFFGTYRIHDADDVQTVIRDAYACGYRAFDSAAYYKNEEELRQALFFDALEAREVMEDILRKPYAQDKDKLTAARDFLDRAGFGPIQRQEVTLTESKWFKDG